MQPLTPLCQTYSAVPSSLLSSDDIRSGNQKQVSGSQAQVSNLHPRTIPRHSFLIRAFIFVLLEIAFIVLVSAALWKPIILHLSVTITEVKGAVTVISIVWHALAIYAVKDILLNIFSAEWTKLDDESHNLSLQELDNVSRLTTGVMDQVKHFVSRRATQSFRLGFLSLLLLILLNGLGPGAIGVNPVPYLYPSTIQVANLTIGLPQNSSIADLLDAMSRATSITQLEIVQNFTTSGYRATQPNLLIPWPSPDSISENSTVVYQSDVIRYNFNCTWKKPSQSNLTAEIWVVADETWIPYSFGAPEPLTVWRTILPLITFGSSGDLPAPGGSNSLSSFVFASINATPTFLSLEGLPSIDIPCNTTLNPSFWDGSPRVCRPSLASFLICNPQLEILPASINATASSLEATIVPGLPTVKNIPRDAANTIFSSSLLDATSQLSNAAELNAISNRIFLNKAALLEWTEPLKPLSLPEINQKMNMALASSAKAYLDGYQPNEADPFSPSFAIVNTSATVEVQKMALVGSKSFFMATTVIVGLLVVLLGVIVATTNVDQLEGFELENIVKRLQLNYVSSSDA